MSREWPSRYPDIYSWPGSLIYTGFGMPHFDLPYWDTKLSFALPDSIHIDLISPINPPAVSNSVETVADALDHPVGGVSLDKFTGARSAAIAINDKTRPVPNQYLLPPLLMKLEALGLQPQDIHLYIATGTHTPTPPTEFIRTIPQEFIDRYPVHSHNCDDLEQLVDMGKTSQGTPILVNRGFLNADLRIVTGNIEPHHFMGFSGGVKTAAIGLAGRSTITRNHAMLPHPNAKTGHYDDNPMRQDVEEIGEKIGIHFALDAMLNLEKEIVSVVAGDPIAVMEAGIPLARQICQVPVLDDYDLVIASAGGKPKDINFYQSQKALTHAALVVRQGGTIILAAACPEGVGSLPYERFMEGITNFSQAMDRFQREGFQIGPHKAYMVGKISAHARVILISQMPPEKTRSLLLEPAAGLDNAIQPALLAYGPQVRVAILPFAVNTVPMHPEQASG